MRVKTFSNVVSPKLEFELAYDDVTVQHFSHYVTLLWMSMLRNITKFFPVSYLLFFFLCSMADKYKEMKNEDDTDYLVPDDEFEPDFTSEHKPKEDHNNATLQNSDYETNKPNLKGSTESSQSEENTQDSSPDSNSTSNINSRNYGVMYFNHAGEATFTRDNVCTTQTEGGTTVINTAHYSSNFNPYSYEKPLRKRNIKFMLAISVIAIIFFFPTGICAYHYALKADKEFDVGIERGDIDLARKYAKKSEKFIIFSFFSAFLVAVIVLAVYERFQMSPEDLRKHSYHHMIAGWAISNDAIFVFLFFVVLFFFFHF